MGLVICHCKATREEKDWNFYEFEYEEHFNILKDNFKEYIKEYECGMSYISAVEIKDYSKPATPDFYTIFRDRMDGFIYKKEDILKMHDCIDVSFKEIFKRCTVDTFVEGEDFIWFSY